MGKRDHREVESYLTRLITHLLKWQVQTSQRSPSWPASISDSRLQLDLIFEKSPSLRRLGEEEALAKVYRRAMKQARRYRLGSQCIPARLRVHFRPANGRRFSSESLNYAISSSCLGALRTINANHPRRR
jgi:hypothetical protein